MYLNQLLLCPMIGKKTRIDRQRTRAIEREADTDKQKQTKRQRQMQKRKDGEKSRDIEIEKREVLKRTDRMSFRNVHSQV